MSAIYVIIHLGLFFAAIIWLVHFMPTWEEGGVHDISLRHQFIEQLKIRA